MNPQRPAAIVLAVAFGLGCAVVLPLNGTVLGRFPNESGLEMGTILAAIFLAAAWSALGPLALHRRLLLSAGWVVAWGIAFTGNAWLAGAEFNSPLHVLLAPLVLLIPWLVLQIPFWFLVLGYGWHVRESEKVAAETTGLQRFGIWQWLIGAVLFVVLVASGIAVVASLDAREHWQLRRNLFEATVGVTSALGCTLLVAASVLPRRSIMLSAATLSLVALATYATARLIQYCQYSVPDGWQAYVATQAAAAVWICAVVAAIRWSGYQLTATRTKLPLPSWLRPQPGWRFSLRTLLVLTTVLGVTFAYFGNLWRRVSRQRAIAAQIEAAGGDLRYHWQFGMGEELDSPQAGKGWTWGYKKNPTDLAERFREVDGKTITQREAYPGPWIIRRLLGDDTFWQVEEVDFWDLETSPTGELESQRPAELQPELLRELPDLRVLRLMYDQVDDDWLRVASQAPKLQSLSLWGYDKGTATRAGVENLRGAKRLRTLSLGGDWVRDDTMRGVATLSQLQSLDLGPTPNLTAAGFAEIKHLTELRELSFPSEKTIDDSTTVALPHLRQLRSLLLPKTSVTDVTLSRLTQLTDLETLMLLETNISDAGLESLAGLHNLKTLYLLRTQVGDAGMESLAGLRSLEVLYLNGTQVSDAGLAPLTRLPNLTYLDLGGTNITNAGLPTMGRMTQLENLDLLPNAITDDGLPHLATLKNLRHLTIGPDISKEAAKRLRAALPNCRIQRVDATGTSTWPDD